MAQCPAIIPGSANGLSTCTTTTTYKANYTGYYIGGAVAAAVIGYLLWDRGKKEETKPTGAFSAKLFSDYTPESGLLLNNNFFGFGAEKVSFSFMGLTPSAIEKNIGGSNTQFSSQVLRGNFSKNGLDYGVSFFKAEMSF